TELLGRAGCGSREAEDELLAHLYADLRRIANRQVRRKPAGPTTPATALAHEVYAELVRASPGTWASRREFLAAYTRSLHNRLVDRIRRRDARAQAARVAAGPTTAPDALGSDEVVALREHLARLERIQPRAAEVLRIHYFVGLTIPEIATTLELGHATVERDLRFARTWLHEKLRP
ncbi:MAG TPA: ECF-type sigma factor, partial [Planctomycetota bacterium]